MATSSVRGTSGSTITIFQPYVPSYRVPLFDELYDLFAEDGLELVVAHARPHTDLASRSDARTGAWSRNLKLRTLPIGRHHLHFRSTRTRARQSRVVVAELASTNLDVYGLAMRSRIPLILWGHGRAYVSAQSRLDSALELWLARRAAHLLVYTRSGAAHLAERGIADDRMTVVHNSTDTMTLRKTMQDINAGDISSFREVRSITSQNVAMFVGALDPAKRIDLLLEASRRIRYSVPDFQLIVAGDGPLREQVQQAVASHPELRLLPYADTRTLALIGAVARICIVPGRVGLVAVDAMTLGVPVITTDWAYHAPERDYLAPAFCVTTSQTGQSLADGALQMLLDNQRCDIASLAAKRASRAFSIENSAKEMHKAILGVARH